MLTLLDEFDDRTKFINSLRHSDSEVRLTGLYQWFIEQPAIKAILDRLTAQVDADKVLKNAGHFTPPNASSPEEIAFVGIRVLQDCVNGEKIFRLTHKYGVPPPFSNYKFQDQLNEFLERFIVPALDYIRTQLTMLDELVSPVDFLRFQLREFLEEPFRSRYSDTSKILDGISIQLSQSDTNYPWYNLGNSCREAMKTFTVELSKYNEFNLDSDTKAGDVKAILKSFIFERYSAGRYSETLIELIQSVWDHIQSILHRNSTSKHEVARVFIWTCLVMLELDYLTRKN